MIAVQILHHTYLHSIYIFILARGTIEREGISEMRHFKNMVEAKDVETKYLFLCLICMKRIK